MHDQMSRYEPPLWGFLVLFGVFILFCFFEDSLFYHLNKEESILFWLPLFPLSIENT